MLAVLPQCKLCIRIYLKIQYFHFTSNRIFLNGLSSIFRNFQKRNGIKRNFRGFSIINFRCGQHFLSVVCYLQAVYDSFFAAMPLGVPLPQSMQQHHSNHMAHPTSPQQQGHHVPTSMPSHEQMPVAPPPVQEAALISFD